MLRLWIIVIFALGLLARDQDTEPNVNSRYTVDSVRLTGYHSQRVSRTLRERLESMVGQKFDPEIVERLVARLRQELRLDRVQVRIAKGPNPNTVAVQLELIRQNRSLDLQVPKLGYHSQQGLTAVVGASAEFKGQRVSAGWGSDGDLLTERFTGVYARYERPRLVGRVGFRFGFDALRQQWNPATRRASLTGESPLYRDRMAFEPALVTDLGHGFRWVAGFNLQNLTNEFPAARPEASHAVFQSLRYARQWEDSGTILHELDAGYDLRAATKFLSSDYVYQRHLARVQYSMQQERHQVRLRAWAGRLNGRAPLYDRFVLGNASTLRGWNKFDLAPLGGNRVASLSTDYQYRWLLAFYDAGSVWEAGGPARVRHSAGVGLRKDVVQVAVAFPFKSGSIDPVFLVGVNF
jgi:hypothetical protein